MITLILSLFIVAASAVCDAAALLLHRRTPGSLQSIRSQPEQRYSRQRRTEAAEQDKALCASATREAAKQSAQADLERLGAMRETLIVLLEAIDAELASAPKPQRITTLRTRQASTEAKLHRLDQQIVKAYDVVHAA